MRPIIFVCGAPHSYTSLTSKFLLDNGGFCDDLWDNPKFDMSYSRFESKEIQKFARKRKNFKKSDLTAFFNSLPKEKVVILKYPLLIYFINELRKFTDREIKVVFVFRNPQDIILSTMDKSGGSFIYHFERISWLYQFYVDCKFPTFPLISEKLLLKDIISAETLLNFCDLNTNQINFNSIKSKELVYRKPSYLKYRFSNFLWKRLSFLFLALKNKDD